MRLRFNRNALLGPLLAAALLAPGSVPAADAPKEPSRPPVRKDRIFLKDIEGVWINAAYVDALGALKSPRAAAKKAAPVVIAIRREGRSYPIVVTNFDKASLEVVLDLEPDGKPGSYRLVVGKEDRPMASSEVKYIPFEGGRNPQGKFDRLRFAEPLFMKGRAADFRLIEGEISPHVNRVVIAGNYRDAKGRAWSFTEGGEAAWPERKLRYELSLNDPGSTCDYFLAEEDKPGAEKKPYGFAWKGGKLTLLPARFAGKKVVCDAGALAVLAPQ